MRDVAARAGVSLKTVSRAVNGEPNVSAAVQARVAAAVAELGFERNDLARSLRHGRSSATLGLLIEDVTNPFYAAIAHEIEQVAAEKGYLLITSSSQQQEERERELVAALTRRRVDGLLLVLGGGDHGFVAEAARTTPTVFLDRPPVGIAADAVLLDNRGGMHQAIEHLLEQGHRRIAFVSDPGELFTAAERLRGYREALTAAGLEIDDALVRLGRHDLGEAERIVEALLALPAGERPTAIVTGNNRHSVAAARALARVPNPVALVGFDDIELAELLARPLTVVAYDAGALGRHGAELIFSRLGATPAEQPPPREIVVPTRLIARGSGELGPSS
ncbi:LacI family DNA-binding transcriptional regulator [Conexibacter sp. JD483]|uniref:LacI family DNA-binding transcriptional regulator n=1 Tax=unclassified Conexibacter TaxID=2627773 RepID=UPI002728D806|nr:MULTISPECIES: LacI family DNA-binding transcriptional regulator [unclassified Conexibacter]MDO8188010.1 LacI family DNA-binding transcriptional regulator [Conexibacter sp. CPCC 205706]MDO8200893.1 LacI family DNA-binding transcriptional regulator [Conexibacter sp. CPCC 205762]MDR9370374.1 LacI family DNA-binding transcriptional regulator [Conexibacter sp. JD483]